MGFAKLRINLLVRTTTLVQRQGMEATQLTDLQINQAVWICNDAQVPRNLHHVKCAVVSIGQKLVTVVVMPDQHSARVRAGQRIQIRAFALCTSNPFLKS